MRGPFYLRAEIVNAYPSPRDNLPSGRVDGRSSMRLPSLTRRTGATEGGKSELHRAGWSLTATGAFPRGALQGQCHRKHTAEPGQPGGKGEKVG